jgi:hypothetical protein
MKNKYVLLPLLGLLLILASCKVGSYTQTVGEPEQAYLLFVSPHHYSGKVHVSLDHMTNFNASVIKEKKGTVKGTVYGIVSGTRMIKVTKAGKLLYEGQVFISSLETKKILLP